MKSDKGKKTEGHDHKPSSGNAEKKASSKPKKQEEEDDDDLEDDEEMDVKATKKGLNLLLQKNLAMMMTMMMLAKMNQMSGKNLKKKRSGILTSTNLIFLNQRIKKAPELLPLVEKKARKKKMILKWMRNSKNAL